MMAQSSSSGGVLCRMEEWLRSRGIEISEVWIQECYTFLQQEFEGQRKSFEDYCEAIFAQWLDFDLNELNAADGASASQEYEVSRGRDQKNNQSQSNLGRLPPNAARITHGVLEADCCLQIEEVMDVGNSLQSQLELVTGSHKYLSALHHDLGGGGGGNAAADSYQALKSVYRPGSRILKVLLTDGRQKVHGLELSGADGAGGELPRLFEEHLKANVQYFKFDHKFRRDLSLQREALRVWREQHEGGEEEEEEEWNIPGGFADLMAAMFVREQEARMREEGEGGDPDSCAVLPDALVGSKVRLKAGTVIRNGMLLLTTKTINNQPAAGPRYRNNNNNQNNNARIEWMWDFLGGGGLSGMNHYNHYTELLRFSLNVPNDAKLIEQDQMSMAQLEQELHPHQRNSNNNNNNRERRQAGGGAAPAPNVHPPATQPRRIQPQPPQIVTPEVIDLDAVEDIGGGIGFQGANTSQSVSGTSLSTTYNRPTTYRGNQPQHVEDSFDLEYTDMSMCDESILLQMEQNALQSSGKGVNDTAAGTQPKGTASKNGSNQVSVTTAGQMKNENANAVVTLVEDYDDEYDCFGNDGFDYNQALNTIEDNYHNRQRGNSSNQSRGAGNTSASDRRDSLVLVDVVEGDSKGHQATASHSSNGDEWTASNARNAPRVGTSTSGGDAVAASHTDSIQLLTQAVLHGEFSDDDFM
eukprot:Nk52_evm22s2462 gene=Nk52_evmTU22s2462